jgi:hypothetical protein
MPKNPHAQIVQRSAVIGLAVVGSGGVEAAVGDGVNG